MPNNGSVAGYFKEVPEEDIPQVKILIVADGNLNFSDSNTENLGLGKLCHALIAHPESEPTVTFTVKTAHRGKGLGAEIANFRFDNHNLAEYGQIWLFGEDSLRLRAPLSQAEIDSIVRFMDMGGGVFAAGDHEDLGESLCGTIPRVRRMRRWSYADALGSLNAPGRAIGQNDTLYYLSNSDIRGDDPAAEQLQRDLNAQAIFPVPVAIVKNTDSKTAFRTLAHPILSTTSGVINTLPDHMHEGECEENPVLDQKYGAGEYSDRDEFYPDVEVPQIIAWSISNASIKPKVFGCLSVYDGHKVQADNGLIRHGRIVVVSTWHHFVNLNSSQFLARGDAEETVKLAMYIRNIATWLVDKTTQETMIDYVAAKARTYYPLLDALKSTSYISEESKYLAAVDNAYEALKLLKSESQILEWAIMMHNRHGKGPIRLRKLQNNDSKADAVLDPDVPVEIVSRNVMGAIVVQHMTGLPRELDVMRPLSVSANDIAPTIGSYIERAFSYQLAEIKRIDSNISRLIS